MKNDYVVITDPNADELFRIHAAGCKDLDRERKNFTIGRVSSITNVKAASGAVVLEAEMNEDFSGKDGCEHPATESYPGGSYGAAGFTGRVMNCCKAKR